MDKKVEELLKERKQNIADIWESCVKENIKKCESPIEELFYIEWLYYNPFGEEDMPGGYGYYIVPQFKINDIYRVDFLISYTTSGDWWFGNEREHPKKDKTILVEIDSHLWHGSSPEQFTKEKKRERKLQKEGYKIIRFSGREIYRDVKKCVNEVIDYFQ